MPSAEANSTARRTGRFSANSRRSIGEGCPSRSFHVSGRGSPIQLIGGAGTRVVAAAPVTVQPGPRGPMVHDDSRLQRETFPAPSHTLTFHRYRAHGSSGFPA